MTCIYLHVSITTSYGKYHMARHDVARIFGMMAGRSVVDVVYVVARALISLARC